MKYSRSFSVMVAVLWASAAVPVNATNNAPVVLSKSDIARACLQISPAVIDNEKKDEVITKVSLWKGGVLYALTPLSVTANDVMQVKVTEKNIDFLLLGVSSGNEDHALQPSMFSSRLADIELQGADKMVGIACQQSSRCSHTLGQMDKRGKLYHMFLPGKVRANAFTKKLVDPSQKAALAPTMELVERASGILNFALPPNLPKGLWGSTHRLKQYATRKVDCSQWKSSCAQYGLSCYYPIYIPPAQKH